MHVVPDAGKGFESGILDWVIHGFEYSWLVCFLDKIQSYPVVAVLRGGSLAVSLMEGR